MNDTDPHRSAVEPPVPGYDGLPAGEIEHRIRSLPRPDLVALQQYERTHADRPAVVRLIQHRVAELDSGATPTSGGGARPGRPEPPRGTSPVRPGTSAEPFSAPPHGSPQQAGKPKGDQRRP